MRFVEEFRDAFKVRAGLKHLHKVMSREWTIMEICGGQTHAILRYGLDQLLPATLRLVHGPGCPVCVTPVEVIDQAIRLALEPGTILCSFGDMLRVPGTDGSLLGARARGADVRIVYSPMDALKIAQSEPAKQVVFLAIGFETTAPANAHTILEAQRRRVRNFSMLVCHVLVPPAIRAILSAPDNQVQGFLAPGHVCTVTGYDEYVRIAAEFQVPFVVTGFEVVDLIYGLCRCVELLEQGRAEVINAYGRAVRAGGNPFAKAEMEEVFEIVDQAWRGIGVIPASGLAIREAYAEFDAARRFGISGCRGADSGRCLSGLVLQGRLKPVDCPEFGKGCTPEHPLGATMVSSEGACAAYYRYALGRTGR